MKRILKIFAALDLILMAAVLTGFLSQNKNQSVTASTKAETADNNVKKIALTFDDGPNPDYSEKVLDILKAKNVKASFFLIGSEAKKYPDIVKREYDEGHIVGNHTYDHCMLSNLTVEQGQQELEKANEVLKKITGVDPIYARPPYGAYNKKLEKTVPMFYTLWDIDTRDWTGRSVEGICQTVFHEAGDCQIILMHDAYPNTVKALPIMIDKLRNEGYEFVTLDEIFFPN